MKKMIQTVLLILLCGCSAVHESDSPIITFVDDKIVTAFAEDKIDDYFTVED